MTRSDRLAPAADQHAREADAAARALAEAIQAEAAERARLDQLQRYREEYRADLRASQAEGCMRADTVRTYANLLEQLERALQQQGERLAAAADAVTRAREAWRASRSRLRAVDRTIERLRSEERRVADRHEQREQVDLAGRTAWGGRDPGDDSM
jgi:flagellar export protein FliJ